MAQKRTLPAPLPIFNQGKRPRTALIAHPNNQQGAGTSSLGSSGGRPSKSYANTNYYSNKENNIPRQEQAEYYNTQSKFSNIYSYHHGRNENFSDTTSETLNFKCNFPSQHHEAKQRHAYSAAKPNVSSMAQAPEQSAIGATTAHASEPTEKANVRRHPDTPKKRELRVLTATAQGIEHWSQYEQHTQILFEVYGKLASLNAKDEMCRHFAVKTSDGSLQCVFWELEEGFPHSISPGQAVRVMGDWQSQHKRLQCYSVRQAQSGEEETAGQFIMAADRHMRKMAGAAT